MCIANDASASHGKELRHHGKLRSLSLKYVLTSFWPCSLRSSRFLGYSKALKLRDLGLNLDHFCLFMLRHRARLVVYWSFQEIGAVITNLDDTL
nr:hypothetical protein CFP56_37058 [Quercus suber]